MSYMSDYIYRVSNSSCLFQGIQRIAAVSLMIGHMNLATDLTLAALRRKKSQEESAAKSKKQ
jgi:hypothetical protein